MNALDALNLGRRNGVTPAMLHTLLTALSDPPMMPSEIAKTSGISTAAVTGAVDRLLDLGFLERHNGTRDRRTKHVFPTEKAFQIFQPALAEVES